MQKIYAHRGASGYAPENTLRAFALAADMGADGVELDVQISKDGRLVVFHDDELSRLTGFTGSVADYTYAELCRMPVIHAVDATERDVAPLLEDVLALLHERGLSVNIELKNSRAAFPALEEKTLEAVEKAGMREKTIYSSFNHYSLLKVRRLDPNAVCGLLYDAMLYQPWDYARQLGVQALHPNFSEPTFVTGEVEAAHSDSPDAAANCFGALMASLFVREEDYWSRTLRLFGASLGRFIYMVDAACDYDADTRKHSYNPVLLMGRQPEDMRDVLTLLLGDASAAFESLPIVSDADILRNILYEGVWQSYNESLHRRAEKQKKHSGNTTKESGDDSPVKGG